MYKYLFIFLVCLGLFLTGFYIRTSYQYLESAWVEEMTEYVFLILFGLIFIGLILYGIYYTYIKNKSKEFSFMETIQELAGMVIFLYIVYYLLFHFLTKTIYGLNALYSQEILIEGVVEGIIVERYTHKGKTYMDCTLRVNKTTLNRSLLFELRKPGCSGFSMHDRFSKKMQKGLFGLVYAKE